MVRRGIPHPCRGATILDAQPGVLPPAIILQPSGLTSLIPCSRADALLSCSRADALLSFSPAQADFHTLL